jgi:hypothetical protein
MVSALFHMVDDGNITQGLKMMTSLPLHVV